MKTVASDKIYIGKSSIKNAGRGVFAKVDIKKGEVIEKCPIIEIPEHDLEYLSNSTFVNYMFFYGKRLEKSFLALGFGSIYNHSYQPNAIYKISKKLFEIIAQKDILANEEITFDYKGKSKSPYPLWFEGKK